MSPKQRRDYYDNRSIYPFNRRVTCTYPRHVLISTILPITITLCCAIVRQADGEMRKYLRV